MKKEQQNLLITIVALIVGIFIGFAFGSRVYNVGPFADLHALPSSATQSTGQSWAIKTGGSWSIKGTNFWISYKQNCADFKAVDTGRTMTDPATGEQFRECQVN